VAGALDNVAGAVISRIWLVGCRRGCGSFADEYQIRPGDGIGWEPAK
jgi:hypothetical protein